MGAALKMAKLPAVAPAAAVAERSLLRFLTCGSVDDGKSTLIGRLLYETGSVFEDQMEALTRDSARFGTTGKDLDFALLVDGLSAEREQGITIDVAYRYFSTPRRSFIAADTPGHEQYTRNMATGASTADVAIVLVDARKGLLPQTRRHSYIVSMLGVRRVIVAINKMDLVGYRQEVFDAIVRDYTALVPELGFAEVHLIPLSARNGDCITGPSSAMPWYQGPALLNVLETIGTEARDDAVFRLPVQWVNRPNLDFRGFSGTVASGSLSTGEAVTVLPRGRQTTVTGILGPDGDQKTARAGEAVTLTFADEVDVSRGDVIVRAGHVANGQRVIAARLLAMTDTPITPGRGYLVKIGTSLASARLVSLDHAIDVHTYARQPAENLPMNAIGLATLRFETDVIATSYADCAVLGSLLLIDPFTNEAAALGIVEAVDGEKPAEQSSTSTALARIGAALMSAGLLSPRSDETAVLRDLTGRMGNAALTGLLIGVIAGAPGAGVIGLAADLVLRPLVQMGLAAVWRAIDARRRGRADITISLDGGGI
ncbi:MAG: sulfate adenylyltransferase subunit CysN [Proteobacteria bacterium]|nr:sulfate adenylyltransferase subunit CysN [Pseudomonadota bacterium]